MKHQRDGEYGPVPGQGLSQLKIVPVSTGVFVKDIEINAQLLDASDSMVVV